MPQTPSQTSQMQTRLNKTSTPQAPSLSDIKTLIEGIMTEKLSPLEKKMDTVADSLKMIVLRMEKIEAKHKEMENRCKRIEEHQMNILSEIEERDRRKTNLVISGIPEKEDGTAENRREWDDGRVEDLFQALTDFDDDDFKKTYRIGRTDAKKPRLLKVICRNDEVKRDVLTRAKDLRSKSGFEGIYVNADQTPLQQRQSKALREEFKRRKDLGEDVILRHGKIVARQNFQ